MQLGLTLNLSSNELLLCSKDHLPLISNFNISLPQESPLTATTALPQFKAASKVIEKFQVDLVIHFIEGEYPYITIFGLNGRIVYSKQAKVNPIEINIESFSPGTYIVKVDKQAFKLLKS